MNWLAALGLALGLLVGYLGITGRYAQLGAALRALPLTPAQVGTSASQTGTTDTINRQA